MGINAAIAQRIAASKITSSGNIIRPGNYLFENHKLLYMGQGTAQGQAFGGEMFIAEMKVLESSSTGEVDRAGKLIVPNAPGTMASYVINLTKMKNGGGDIKALLCALLGEEEAAIDENVIVSAVSDAQPFQYLRVKDQAWNKPQRGDPNKDFTRHRWESVVMSDQDLLVISQRREAEKKAAAAPAPAK